MFFKPARYSRDSDKAASRKEARCPSALRRTSGLRSLIDPAHEQLYTCPPRLHPVQKRQTGTTLEPASWRRVLFDVHSNQTVLRTATYEYHELHSCDPVFG